MRLFFPDPETGGAALEYIIVSVFGLLLAIAAIGFVAQTAKQKMATVEQKLGVSFDLDALNPFD